MKEKISVVLIAYNDQKHIERAIQSVLNQSLKDIKLICVDDCSNDNTIEIMNKYRSFDNRIEVISAQNNGGALNARYIGIQNVKSKYIMFLDSDDYLEEDACEIAYKNIKEKNADCLIFGTKTFFDESVKNKDDYKFDLMFFKHYFSDQKLPSFKSKDELLKYAFKKEKLSWNFWNKIYTTDLVKKAFNHYKGERISCSEDMLFSSMVFIHCKKLCKISDKLYNYRIGSGISTSKDRKRILTREDMDNVAGSYLAYSLLIQWLNLDKIDTKEIEEGLNIIENRALYYVLDYFYNHCDDNLASDFYETILKYTPAETLIESLINYVFDEHLTNPIDALVKLSKCSLVKVNENKIKNIGMFYHRLNNGGVERVMSLLTPILINSGYNVSIITEDNENELDYKLPKEAKRIILGNKFKTNLERFNKLKTIINKNKIDTIIYHAWVGPNLIQDSIAIRSCGIPLITYMHNNFSLPFSDSYFYYNHLNLQHKLYTLSNALISLTKQDTEWWKNLGYNSYYLPNPYTYYIDESEVSKLDSQNVLWIARISKEKQFDDMVEIAKIVHKTNKKAKFLVLGKCETDEEFEELQEELDAKGYTDFIKLEGFQQDLTSYYKDSSLYLLTSKVEGFSMSLFESKEFGLPTVAYELNNLDYFTIDDGVVSVKQRDVVGAATEICKILNDAEYRENLGHKARESFNKIYSIDLESEWKKVIDEVEIISLNSENYDTKTFARELMLSLEEFEGNNRDTVNTITISNGDSVALQELDEIKNSTCWILMRIATYIPRLILDFIHYAKDNSLKEAFAWLHNKNTNFGKVAKKLLSRENGQWRQK